MAPFHRLSRTPLLTAAALGLVALVAAPPAYAAPALVVSATENLEEGQKITVEGSGFAPGLAGIAVGQCKVGYEGPADCNLPGGATFRNADANGAIATVNLTLTTSFGGIDCLAEQCVIAAAPLPTSSGPEDVAANTIEIPIYFGGPAPAAPAAPATPSAPAVVTTNAPGASTAVLTAAEDDGDGTLTLLILSNIALAGVGLYLGFGRRKAGAR